MTLVYVAHRRHDQYTYLYQELTKEHPAIAEDCIRQLHALLSTNPEITLSSPNVDILTTAKTYFEARYHAELLYRPGARKHRFNFGPDVEPKTIATVLSRFRSVFGLIADLGWRIGRPFAQIAIPAYLVRRHRQSQKMSPPYVYYRIKGGRRVAVPILHNKTLPDELRRAAQAAGWSSRDLAILEICLSSGARIDEVTGLTWASLVDGGLLARNKGQGDALIKNLSLNSAARAALDHHLTNREGLGQDQDRKEDYQAWLKGRSHTPERYVRYLLSKNLELSQVPIFLTRQGNPYTPASFRRHAWGSAMKCGNLVVVIHQTRHWRINQDLTEIAEAHGASPKEHVPALLAYTERMGWVDALSIATYDHAGVATKLLKLYFREVKLLARESIEHPDEAPERGKERARVSGMTFEGQL
ncbi:hypothetical protein [Deinococcus aquatilis]|uniref:hypothetical protein n=1 Tax=Deinococcus aquatilis TaxID=519440 RepID=UPI00037521B6|nr:hypothetical protein [Deinococcus aquatilis]